MWKAALLTLCLLVNLVEKVRSNDAHPSFYRVKLCGREFIRAVIFTCGGSRWRRSVGDSGKSVYERLSIQVYFSMMCFPLVKQWYQEIWLCFLSALIGEEAFDPWNTNPIPQHGEQDPAESHVWIDQTLNEASVAAGFSRSSRSPMSEGLMEALRSADRKGRDVVVGLSNACCKWGCSKSEISSLCWISLLIYILSCHQCRAPLFSYVIL